MLKNARPGITPEQDGKRGPMKFIEDLRAKGHLVAYVGDVVGTGSSASRHQQRVWGSPARTSPSCRTSASAASRLGGKIAPIFYNTHGRLRRAADRARRGQLNMGDVIECALRRQGAEGRQGHRRVPAQERRAVRRGARRRPHP
jgi:aconitate hydratase 2/2-methylisocitrate dehydratase